MSMMYKKEEFKYLKWNQKSAVVYVMHESLDQDRRFFGSLDMTDFLPLTRDSLDALSMLYPDFPAQKCEELYGRWVNKVTSSLEDLWYVLDFNSGEIR